MATHFSSLAWGIPWTEVPGGLRSMGSRRGGHIEAILHACIVWYRHIKLMLRKKFRHKEIPSIQSQLNIFQKWPLPIYGALEVSMVHIFEEVLIQKGVKLGLQDSVLLFSSFQ